MRFRMGRIGLTADVKKMFRQAEIAPDQYDLQRIFWRESANEPIREYQLRVVTYGTKSASYLAVRAMQQCGTDHGVVPPRGRHHTERLLYG